MMQFACFLMRNHCWGLHPEQAKNLRETPDASEHLSMTSSLAHFDFTVTCLVPPVPHRRNQKRIHIPPVKDRRHNCRYRVLVPSALTIEPRSVPHSGHRPGKARRRS